MKLINSDISFGTKILIGDLGARNSLPKHKKALTEGLLIATKKLSCNDISDKLVFNFQGTGKDLKIDILNIDFYSQNNEYQSSLNKKLSKLDKITPKKVAKFILDSYDKLKNSKQQNSSKGYYPVPSNTKITKVHRNKINELIDSFGFDDWTCA